MKMYGGRMMINDGLIEVIKNVVVEYYLGKHRTVKASDYKELIGNIAPVAITGAMNDLKRLQGNRPTDKEWRQWYLNKLGLKERDLND